MILVALDRLTANPWQTRQGADEMHVKELAGDIQARRASRPETMGLLQVPAGRLVGMDGRPPDNLELNDVDIERLLLMEDHWRIQLAYGHSRLAAFRLLAESVQLYREMPVEIVWFSDEEMATAAWSENAARADLTAMEEASAIQRMLDQFGWTQEQVGKRLGLNRSTVANKLRLLKLPEELRAAVQAGELSERQAVAVLPAMDIPEAGRKKAGWSWEQLQSALKHPGNNSADVLRKKAADALAAATTELDQNAPPMDLELDLAGTRATRCEGCEMLWTREGHQPRCKDAGCFWIRYRAWQRMELQAAAEATGLAALDPDERGNLVHKDFSSFNTWADKDGVALADARERQCPNLRLAWEPHVAWNSNRRLDGHQHIIFLCLHQGGGHCACEKTANEQLNAKRIAEEMAAKAQIKALRGRVETAVKAALGGLTEPAQRVLLYEMADYNEKSKVGGLSGKKLFGQLVEKVVKGVTYWEGGGVDEAVRKWCGQMGLKLPAAASGSGDGPLDNIRRRWERIQGWIERMDAGEETQTQVIRGNFDNLMRLADEISQVDQVGNPEALALGDAIAGGLLRVNGMLGTTTAGGDDEQRDV